MRGRPGAGIAGNPVLIGAATVLVVIVAVFLSYNANQGLPFVPTYQLSMEVPNAAQLVRGNEVRIGGARVGAVNNIEAIRRDDGSSFAKITMKLEKAVDPLPVDSSVLIRPKSVLGLKYIEITRGKADEGFQDGDTIPVKNQTADPVEFDEFVNLFDEETRTALRRVTAATGDAFAGRGQSINTAIGEFRPLLVDVLPVLQNLRDPETGLVRFVRELADAAAIVAPVAETQAQLFVNLDATFEALREVRTEIQETIEEGPATLDAGIESFPVQRPFLANTEGLFRDLRPGVRSLRTAAPDLADALSIGRRTLLRTPAFNRRLLGVITALRDFANDPLVPRGIRKLTQLTASVNPTLHYLAPAQTTCNYLAFWFRNVASLLSEGDANGTWQRFIIITTPQGPNNEGGPSSAPANGPTMDNHLHTNPYPNTAAPGQPNECEAANEPYLAGQTVIGNVEGTQPARTEGTP